MTTKTLEEMKQFWEDAAKRFPANGVITPTSRDPYLGQLEENNILGHLETSNTALELGCGDGLHTVKYAHAVRAVFALDVAESLAERAAKRFAAEGVHNINIAAGSVLDARRIYQGWQFDRVISQRCLINLPLWEHQQEAIRQVRDVLSDDGLFLLTEGFQGELDNINEVRRKLGLAEIVVDYNRHMVREDFESFVKLYFEIQDIRHYGTYLFLSRVYHPLAVWPDEPRHDSKLNQVAMTISKQVLMPDLERFSYNLFYVLKKRP